MTDVPSKPPQITPPPKPKSRAPTTIFSSPPQLPDRSSLHISNTASTPSPTLQIHIDPQQPKSTPPPLPERQQSFSNSPNRQTQSFSQKPALPPRDSQYNTISGSTFLKNNTNNDNSHHMTNGNASSIDNSFVQGNRVLNTNKSQPILQHQQQQQSHSPQPNHQLQQQQQQQQSHSPQPNHQPLSPQQQKDLAQKRSTMPLPPRPNKNRPLPTPTSPDNHPLAINEENSITEEKEQPHHNQQQSNHHHQQQQSSSPPPPPQQQQQQNIDISRKPIVAPPTPTIQ
ncbi:hypothetical protein ACTFIV_011023 [Dictyostelium citrinum]